MSADGTTLIYSTFLGGSGNEVANGMVVVGNRGYLAGHTGSSGFPTTTGAYDRSYNGGTDVFMAIIDASLTGSASLVYSTFFGGTDTEGLIDFASGTVTAPLYYDTDIEVDGYGNVYIAGRTLSSEFEGFPRTANAYDGSYNGAWDAFLAKISPSGNGSSDLLYSTYFGGGSDEWVHEIALDGSNNVYVAGGTSSATGFPTTTNAYDRSYNGNWDAFLAKISPLGNGGADLLYSTYFGGTDHDRASGVDVDSNGNAYMSGPTLSSGGEGFPTTAGAYDTSYNGNRDAFVAKISPSGNGGGDLLYSTYLGGTGDEACIDGTGGYNWIFDWSKIELGCNNMIYLHVPTESSNFLTTTGAYDTSFNGADDITMVKMNLGGNGAADLLYSTYLGGNGTDHLASVAVSDEEEVGVTVGTESRNYPVTPGVYQVSYREPADENVAITVAGFTDWGDAPASYGTLKSAGGPRHVLGPMRLGTGWDAEGDGNPNAFANGDDMAADWPDDEDGIVLLGSSTSPGGPWSLPYNAGEYGAVDATVTGPGSGWLAGWFDWDLDGTFELTERVVWGSVVAGTQTFTFTVPSDAAGGPSVYVRFRLGPGSSDVSDATSTSLVCGGEVEDYVTPVNPTAVELASFVARSSGSGSMAVTGVVATATAGLLVSAAMAWRTRRVGADHR